MSNGQLVTTTGEERTRERTTTTDAVLELDGIGKQYANEEVIADLSLSVRDGEILTLLGPSGCGKTTTLRLIAGLEKPNAGEVRLNSEPVAGHGQFVPPEHRGVGVVFQEFALFPHMTARENIAFGLQEWAEPERDARVDSLLELVGLKSHGEHHPEELSGGQQQRIALARSLAPEPEMLLLDEPFSNLDVDLRVEMREEVRQIIKEAGVTAVSVTHDQEEALSISDRVAVMNDGDIEQIDTPEQIFQQPESRFVAGFLGHASFLSGEVHGDHVDTAVGRVLRDNVHGLATQYDGTGIDLLVRPDDVTAYPASEPEANGTVVYRRYLGPTVLYRIELDSGETIECMHNHSDHIDLDERVAVRVTAEHELAWFPAGQRTAAQKPTDDPSPDA